MLNRWNDLRKNRKRVIGLNERYLEYIRPYNKRRSFEIADDKVYTKKLLARHGIAVPEKIAVITDFAELNEFDPEILPKSFVVKPVNGAKGGGIEIFYNRDKNGNWIRSDKSRVNFEELTVHMKDILDGKYSLNNERDIVLIEERISPIKNFRYHTYKGTPDVRVIVFNSIPVMAMLRLPTEASEGKANLDMGGIGAGIDIAVGKTTHAISGKGGEIERIPSTRLPISGLRIPYWDTILENSIKASQVSKLGYAGIDFLIDKDKGPVIIELNARPGLSIQLANDDGLRWRLKKASGLKVKTVSQGVRLAKDLFGGEIDEEIANISGKKVIGIYENIRVYKKDGELGFRGKAKIDTGADLTSIDISIAKKIGLARPYEIFSEVIENYNANDYLNEEKTVEIRTEILALIKERFKEEKIKEETIETVKYISSSHGASFRPFFDIDIELGGVTYTTGANVFDRSALKYKVIVGRKSLYKYLVDPSK